MNPWAFLVLIVAAGTGLALLTVDVRATARRIRVAWLRRFPRWRATQAPIFVTYGEAERLLTQKMPENRRWQISCRLEDRNQQIGYVWLELAERVVL